MKIKKAFLAAMITATSVFIVTAIASPPVFAASAEQGSSNGKPFQTLQAQIDILSIDLADAVALLQSQIDTLVSEQADQDTLIAALQSAVAALDIRVSQNEGDIATLQAIQNLQDQLIAALDTRVTDLEARVAANENDIAALVLVDQALQGMITAINSQISIINARITANDGDIAILQGQVSQLQLNLTNVQLQLATKQDRVNGICAAGSSIRQIYSNGSVVCEIDSVSSGVGTLDTFRSVDTVDVPNSLILVRVITNYRYCTGSNYRAVGGGYSLSNHLGIGGHVLRSYPTSSNTGWAVTVRADSTFARTLSTYVVCARVQ